ncbi:hypothetical protein H7F33_13660 [Pedobacter sp. PAMC26386]|nr:hypothetical protein H7F33_13660 [Pedobacter sp. PAMC26386]
MKHERKIAMIVNPVKIDDEDSLDVLYWLSRTVSERLSEVSRLIKNYFTWINGNFPDKI